MVGTSDGCAPPDLSVAGARCLLPELPLRPLRKTREHFSYVCRGAIFVCEISSCCIVSWNSISSDLNVIATDSHALAGPSPMKKGVNSVKASAFSCMSAIVLGKGATRAFTPEPIHPQIHARNPTHPLSTSSWRSPRALVFVRGRTTVGSGSKAP